MAFVGPFQLSLSPNPQEIEEISQYTTRCSRPNKFKEKSCINLEKNQRLSRACIIHLVIKRTNWSYVKTISCSGSHLGIPINIKNTKFERTFQLLMHSLGSISAIASEKKIFLYFPIWSCVNTMTCGGGHPGFQIITKNTNLIRDHSMIIHAQNGSSKNIPAKFGFKWFYDF